MNFYGTSKVWPIGIPVKKTILLEKSNDKATYMHLVNLILTARIRTFLQF